jgi:hypothetical protein
MPILNGALLCDAAHDYNGRVSILGGFINILNVPGFPFPAPIWYAARVAFSAEEVVVEEREMIVRARDPANQILAEVRAHLRRDDELVRRAAAVPDLASGTNLVFPFPFIVAAEGIYWVDLIVDGELLSALPLKVILQQPNQ